MLLGLGFRAREEGFKRCAQEFVNDLPTSEVDTGGD